MLAIRRGSSGLRRLPHRQGWHNLGAYKTTSRDDEAWKCLRQKDADVELCVNKFSKDLPQKEIDWSYWEKNIGHTEIVKFMKSFYEQQLSVLRSVGTQDHKNKVETQKEGWEIFDSAVSRCEQSVESSESLVANGARGLWVSYHNPPVTKVDDNEWLDSDKHWQAVVERQYLYNPNASIAEENLPKWKEVFRDGSNFKMETFNARSDTPVLYQYMDQLPSFEYYDIHRRAFLEHMLYYLCRTGGDYRMFPECPPAKWLAHIEELRYQFLAVTQRRRSAEQLANELREVPLDMQPLDANHHGEDFHLKLLNTEIKTFEQIAATLMGNYMFLCYPYIPVQTDTALYRVIAKYADTGGGHMFTIGEDVNALFFLPNEFKDMQNTPNPREAFHNIMDHGTLSGFRFNPGYASLLDMHSQLVNLRGHHWFSAPGESFCDAFMRKLHKDDPSYHIYKLYVDELKERFESAVEVGVDSMLSSIRKVETNYRKETELLQQLRHYSDVDIMDDATKEVNRLQGLDKNGELQSLLNSGAIVAVTTTREGGSGGSSGGGGSGGVCRIVDKTILLNDIEEYADSKQLLMEVMKAEKVNPLLLADSVVGNSTTTTTSSKLNTTTTTDVGSITGMRSDMQHLEPYLREFTDK
eukprot:GHVS01032186.1.p1 GENE.GHVS01032186.1~~GHVS01032186.1.p1  ORF type:complete len:638 (-),score=113.76 GHVS01032186.1:128-2041(-)